MKRLGSILLVAIMVFAALSVNCYAAIIPGEIPVNTLVNTVDGIQLSWNYDSFSSKYMLYRKTADTDWILLADSYETYYLDTQVENGVVYTYAVCGKNSEGETGTLGETGKSIMRLGEVNVSVKTLTNGVSLKWKTVKGAEGYRIYRGDGYSYELIKTTGAGVLEYTDKKAVNGSTNYYKVVAYNGYTDGAESEQEKSVYYLKAPKITSAKNQDGKVLVKWTENEQAYYYIVYRKKVGGSYKKLTTVYDTQYYDETAKSGVKYIYAVKASEGTDQNSRSAESKQVLFLKKTTVTVTNNKDGVKVKWKKVAGAGGYKIYRKLGSNSYKLIKTVSSSETSYIDKKASSGKTYNYMVKAYKSSTTVGSDAVKIKYLAAPKITTAKATSSGIQLKWKKVAGASGYSIYEKVGGEYYYVTSVSKTSFKDVTAKKGERKRFAVLSYNGDYESALSATKTVKQTVKNKQVPTKAEMAAYALILLDAKLKNPSTLVVHEVYYRGDYVYIWYSAANGYGNMVDGWVRCYHSVDRGLFSYSIIYKSGYILTDLEADRPNTWDGTVSWKSIQKADEKIPEITWYNPYY